MESETKRIRNPEIKLQRENSEASRFPHFRHVVEEIRVEFHRLNHPSRPPSCPESREERKRSPELKDETTPSCTPLQM